MSVDGDSWLLDGDWRFWIFREAPATTIQIKCRKLHLCIKSNVRCVLGIVLANTRQDSTLTMLCREVKVRTENTTSFELFSNPLGSLVSLASIPAASACASVTKRNFKGLAVDSLSLLLGSILVVAETSAEMGISWFDRA